MKRVESRGEKKERKKSEKKGRKGEGAQRRAEKSIKAARKSRTPTRFESASQTAPAVATQPRKLVYEAPKRGHNPWILFRSLLIINTMVVLTLAL